MKRQNLAIVGAIFLVFLLLIGYAIFKKSVTINSSYAMVKDLNIVFFNVGAITEVGSKNAKATITPDKKKVIISVPNLAYKKAYTLIPITIKNDGNIPAKLESIYEYGASNQDVINVSYDGPGVTDSVLNPNDTITFNVRISWENDTTNDFEKIEFIIKFNYVQV